MGVLNWFTGNIVEQNQWESGNSMVSYPFADDSVPKDFPTNLIVDACIVVPYTKDSIDKSNSTVELTYFHESDIMVSIMISIDGTPSLHAKVLKEYYKEFSPIKLESLDGKCSGMITFGSIRFDRIITIRTKIPFSESVIVRPVVGRLEKFVQHERDSEISGDIGIELPLGINMSISEEGDTSTIQFTASKDIRESVPAPCSNTDPISTMPVPISSINGIRPDKEGRIAIVFAKSVGDVPV